MTAMQQGWERGRSVFDPPAASPAGTEAGGTPGGTPGSGPEAGTADNGAAHLPDWDPVAETADSGAPAPDTGTATAPEPEQTEDRGTSA
jgi:hypothetical protein